MALQRRCAKNKYLSYASCPILFSFLVLVIIFSGLGLNLTDRERDRERGWAVDALPVLKV